jgi:ATP phosphoribosyltransferase
MGKVRFAIPKGHLAGPTFRTLERAGYVISGEERTYRPSTNDPRIELKVLRPQEIPVFVSDGLQEVGITGLDWLRETRVDVETLLDLEYSKVQLIVAVPKPWTEINSLSDLLEEFSRSGKVLRISTEYLNLSAEYLKSSPAYRRLFDDSNPLQITPWWKKGENEKVAIYLSFGATEAKPPENADAIIELTETGTSIEQNDLKIIERIMESTAVLIANKKALKDPATREKIYDILTLLRGVVDGRKKLHIFMNVSKENLATVLKSLPALKSPTISPLSDKDWYSLNTVVEKDQFLELLPALRKLAQGLVVYEPRQVLSLDEITTGEDEK